MSIRFMTVKHVQYIQAAKSYSALAAVALDIIRRIPSDYIGMVCGPISSGGHYDRGLNLHSFNAAIETLLVGRYSLFNQMPFEDKIGELHAASGRGYDERVLTNFYGPLFESGLITTQYFMHNWRTSHGATWEHERAEERGIKIVYLDEKHQPCP